MALNNTALASLAAQAQDLFERVWGRMDRFEGVRALVANSLCTGTPTVPAGHTAESALSYLDWNNGDGSYVSTSPYRYSGGILTAKPYSVRASLKAAFNADRSGFLAAATNNNDNRALELVRIQPPSSSPAPSATPMLMWYPPDWATLVADYPTIDAANNIIRPVPAFFGQNGAAWNAFDVVFVANQLAALPEGRRFVKCGDFGPFGSTGAGALWGQPFDNGTGKVFFLHDQEFLTTNRRGVMMAIWLAAITQTNSLWYQFWAALKARGEILLGPGNGEKICNGLITDVERAPSFVTFKRGDAHGSGRSSTFPQYFATAEWGTFRTTIFKPVLSQAIWDDAPNWDEHTDERAFTFDAALEQYYMATLSAGLTPGFRAAFPAGEMYDYDARRYAPGSYYNDVAYSKFHHPYGTGGSVGGGNSLNMYNGWSAARYNPQTQTEQTPAAYAVAITAADPTNDQLTLSTNPFTTGAKAHITGTPPAGLQALSPNYDEYYVRVVSGNVVSLHTSANGAINNTGKVDITSSTITGAPALWDAVKAEWNAFLMKCSDMASAIACQGSDKTVAWIAVQRLNHDVIPDRVGPSGLNQELYVRAAMMGGLVAWYGALIEGATTAKIKKIVDCVAEADSVIGHKRYGEPTGVVNYDQAFSFARVWSAGRMVYRVTPDPRLATTVNTSGGNVVFTNSGGSLTIPGAKLNAQSQSALAPLGYWVEQFGTAGALFLSKAEIGTAGATKGGTL